MTISTMAVVLAAGAGVRLGGACKALLRAPGGHTFLSAIAESASFAGAGEIVVVAGPPFGDDVREHARALALDVAWNPEPERGMASSVAAGFRWAAEHSGADAALLWPVDHPKVPPEIVGALVDGLSGGLGNAQVAVPLFRGQAGHPALCRRALWPELAACEDELEGARTVIRRYREVTSRIEVDEPGVVRDVDTPDMLEGSD